MEVFQWQVGLDEAGQRLDVFLAGKIAAGSRSAVARAIQRNEVEIPGRKSLKAGLVLRAGETVVYRQPEPQAPAALAQALPLEIVFEDDDLAVINKPAGLVTHPAPGHPAGTLVNALLHHLQGLSGINGGLRPGIVHRLDKETSGLLAIAKTDRAHQALSESLRVRDMKREYDAVVWGKLAESGFTIDTLLGRDPHDRKRFAVVRVRGKRAVTHGRVEKSLGSFSLLRLQLETGRTHQIRVHCQYAGMPVVGDRAYGKRGEAGLLQKMGLNRPTRQLLHAAQLSLVHPLTGQELTFKAPWPGDFQEFYAAAAKLAGR